MPSYPLTLPSSPGPNKSNLFKHTKAQISRSPYTGRGQVFDWGVDLWQIHLEFPLIKEDDAGPWIQFQRNIRGVVGTFQYDISKHLAGQDTTGASTMITFRLLESLTSWEQDEERNFIITIDAVEEPTG